MARGAARRRATAARSRAAPACTSGSRRTRPRATRRAARGATASCPTRAARRCLHGMVRRSGNEWRLGRGGRPWPRLDGRFGPCGRAALAEHAVKERVDAAAHRLRRKVVEGDRRRGERDAAGGGRALAQLIAQRLERRAVAVGVLWVGEHLCCVVCAEGEVVARAAQQSAAWGCAVRTCSTAIGADRPQIGRRRGGRTRPRAPQPHAPAHLRPIGLDAERGVGRAAKRPKRGLVVFGSRRARGACTRPCAPRSRRRRARAAATAACLHGRMQRDRQLGRTLAERPRPLGGI